MVCRSYGFLQVNCKVLHSLTLLKKRWDCLYIPEIVTLENTHGQIVKLNNMLVLYINALSSIKKKKKTAFT